MGAIVVGAMDVGGTVVGGWDVGAMVVAAIVGDTIVVGAMEGGAVLVICPLFSLLEVAVSPSLLCQVITTNMTIVTTNIIANT